MFNYQITGFFLLFACGEDKSENEAPTINITSPSAESTFGDGDTIQVVVAFSDAESNSEDLELSWVLDGTPICEDIVANASGEAECSFLAVAGEQEIRAELMDPDGKSAGARLSLTVADTDVPSVEIIAPTIETRLYSDSLIVLEGFVSDSEDAPTDLEVIWTSSLDGDLNVASPSEDGTISDSISLSEGSHALSLSATDSSAKTAEHVIEVEVLGPNTAPSCGLEILSGDTSAGEGSLVTLSLSYEDVEQPSSELSLTLSSDLDGGLGTPTASSSGASEWETTNLSLGLHEVSFQVVDEQDGMCVETVNITIGSAPTVTWNTPVADAVFEIGEAISFEATISDLEETPDQIEVSWTSDIDGLISEQRADSSGQAQFILSTLSAGTHSLVVEATDRDGMTASGSLSISVNQQPEVVGLLLEPSAPTTSDDLEIAFTTSDADGDVVQTSIEWHVDGVLSTASSSLLLPASATSKGETWEALVVPNDGFHNGPSMNVSRTILNTPPEILSVGVSPSSPTQHDTLSCSTGATNDVDGDAVVTQTQWWVNGNAVSETSDSLSEAYFERGDDVYCAQIPDDGETQGSVVVSNTVVIGNASPTVSSVMVSPSDASSTDVISCVYQFVDLDGDADQSTVSWTVNGLAANTGVVLQNSVIQGDSVTCSVLPNDGQITGPVMQASLVVGNAVPTIATVTISPSAPNASEPLQCSYTGYYDADGDPDLSTFQWEINGNIVSSGVSISAGYAGGDSVACVVTPSDGLLDGEPVSDIIGIANTPPVVSNVVISPSTAVAGEELNCSYSYVDIDGDNDASQIQWYRNGQLASTDETFQGVRGDSIRCDVVANDGTSVGNTESATISITNAVPVINALSISPADPKTNDLLSIVLSTEDSDGDSINYQYEWYVDGVLQATTSELNGLNNFSRGQNIYVVVTPDDGIDTGASQQSSAVMVVNTPPSEAVFEINPGESVRVVDDLICEVVVPAFDADGDALTSEIRWYVDDVEVTTSETSFLTGDTILFLETNKRETWRCEVEVDDGNGGVLMAEHSVLITADFTSRVGAGASHSCAIDSNGYGICWGIPNTQVTSIPPDVFLELVSAADHNCGLTEDGIIKCWGQNNYGQAPALQTASSGQFQQVATSRFHTCGLTDLGEIECFGECLNGECLSDPGPWVHVGTSNHLTCAVDVLGGLSCWGVTTSAQNDVYLAASSGSNQYDTYGCAIGENTIRCWGSEPNNNVLGAPPGEYDFLSLGNTHSCAIDFEGYAECWGICLQGQCGTCSGQDCTIAGGPYISISAGSGHTCMMDNAGLVSCIGQDSYGKSSSAPGN